MNINNKRCDYSSNMADSDIKQEKQDVDEFEVPINSEVVVKIPNVITRQTQIFDGEWSRTAFERTRHPNVQERKTYHCYLCNLPDSRSSGKQIVKREIHYLVKCGICSMVFPTALQMKTHIQRVHIGQRARPFPCSMCEKSFRNYPSLQGHIQYNHDPQPKYSCPPCRKIFRVKTHFNYHMQSIHEKIRHKCPMCPNSYTSKSYLKLHVMQMHRELITSY